MIGRLFCLSWKAGDHWVVYATVDAGKVLDPDALSAVHQRKTGTTY
jgi:flavin reductase (DIM6/NTAB) family NADH-FMN oxidoreductase RutF